MANYDPRFLQMHAPQHPSMMANMMARYGGNPPAPPPMNQSTPVNHRAAGPGGAAGQNAAEEAKKRQNVGWESTYKTAQRIPFPETRAACGEKVGEFVEDLARAIGCPVEYVLVPLLPCVGGLLGTHTSINVHRGWSEPPVLWSMVGAPQGSRRSAVIRQLLNPILSLQKHQKDKATAETNHEMTSQDRALYSGTRITLPAITEVLHRNDGHAFSLTENIENLHDMLGLLQPVPTPRLVSVIEDLYEGLPLVAVENGRVTTILGSNFCHGGFSSPEYIVTVLMKYPAWLSSRLLMSCPVADHVKGVFGDADSDADFPSLDKVYEILLNTHKNPDCKYRFDKEAVQELSRFFDEEWSSVLTQLEQNEHEALIGKSMGQIVRISGILKSLENAIYAASDVDRNQINDYEWNWVIDVDTIKCAINLGKYFLEQKLAMTFMVGTGFFNNLNAMEDGTGSMNGSQDQDYPDSPTTLPQTAFHESGHGQSAYQSNKGGGGGSGSNSNSGSSGSNGRHASDRRSSGDFGVIGQGRVSYMGGGSGGGGGGNSSNNPYNNMQHNTPILPSMQQQQHQQHQQQQEHQQQQQQHQTPTSSKQESSQSSANYVTPTQQTNSLFELPKTNTEAEVDFSTLPQTMTTMEEDVSEMMQAIDFVHFSKTQFVAVHGRRIKRLLECYDDGHGVSATTAAQKSITPPVKVHGTNNRHPAWASALFFQKVAELELGIAEQGRHPHNRKVCWRFKRKPVSQLQERDFQLLQYLRIDMDKYSHFGSNTFNPAMMVNSGLISLGPSSNHSSQQSPSSSPIPSGLDDDGPGSNTQTSPASGIPLSANQSGPRNPSMSLNIKPEIF